MGRIDARIGAAAASGPLAPSLYGPWFAVDGPWRTPLPADWASHVHPDSDAMMQQVYIGTDYSSSDVHAWAYAETEMVAKLGSFGSTAMKWCGPGGVENVVYGRPGDPFITVWMDFPTHKASSVSCPLPYNWTGYDLQSSGERRTIVVNHDGRAWNLYGLTPPGVTPNDGGAADTDWHASDAFQVQNWTAKTMTWAAGGSGIAQGPGLILPSDIAYAQQHGDFGHVIAINAQSSALGTYNGPNGLHPSGVYPATKGLGGTGGDGRTQGIVGLPHGARVFLDPTLTDADLTALGLTKEWEFWFAHTFQRYGVVSKESNTGQGAAGNIMCETVESIAWNNAQGIYDNFEWPWLADGTMTGDHDNSTYSGAFPKALMPTSGTHWKVWDWRHATPGINS